MKVWKIIKPEDIKNYLSDLQVQALRKNSDPLNAIATDITALTRSEVASYESNVLPQNPALIPPELMSSACHLIIEALQSRIPTLQLSKDQVRNAENARKQLRRVAKGEVKITPPSPPWVLRRVSKSPEAENLTLIKKPYADYENRKKILLPRKASARNGATPQC